MSKEQKLPYLVTNKSFILAIILSVIGIATQSLFGLIPALFQALFTFVGLSIYVILQKINVHHILRLQFVLYAISIFLLIILFFIADPIRGSRRWFVIGGFNAQPSVILTPFFILVITTYLASIKEYTVQRVAILFFLVLVPVLLIFKQPDLGTALILFTTFGFMFFYSGIPVRKLLLLGLFSLPFIALLPFVLKPYQVQRLESFLNPYYDTSGINYNSLQSIIAIGSGGFLGKGILFATQSKLNFLPESHTDFIFATYIETFGFVGGIILLTVLFLFLVQLLREIYDAQNRFFQLAATGVFGYIFVQVLFNIGMNLRIMPVVGIPLPFISYGGSSILTLFMLLGLKDKLKDLES